MLRENVSSTAKVLVALDDSWTVHICKEVPARTGRGVTVNDK